MRTRIRDLNHGREILYATVAHERDGVPIPWLIQELAEAGLDPVETLIWLEAEIEHRVLKVTPDFRLIRTDRTQLLLDESEAPRI